MAVQMRQRTNVRGLIAAHFARAVGKRRALRTGQRCALAPQPLGAEEAPNRRVRRQAARRGNELEVVVMELDVPLGMGQVLVSDGGGQFSTDSAHAAQIGARHRGQQRGRVRAAPRQGQPAFERGNAEAYIAPMDRMAPGLPAQFGQSAHQFAPYRRGRQQLPDDQQAQSGPALPGTGIVFGGHGDSSFRTSEPMAR